MAVCVRVCQCVGGRDVIEVAMKTANEDKKVTIIWSFFIYLVHNFMYSKHSIREVKTNKMK